MFFTKTYLCPELAGSFPVNICVEPGVTRDHQKYRKTQNEKETELIF
jgi:hypothetical protein